MSSLPDDVLSKSADIVLSSTRGSKEQIDIADEGCCWDQMIWSQSHCFLSEPLHQVGECLDPRNDSNGWSEHWDEVGILIVDRGFLLSAGGDSSDYPIQNSAPVFRTEPQKSGDRFSSAV